MAPMSPPAAPTRKRSQLQEPADQQREETIIQYMAPVKRRRSSASAEEQPSPAAEEHQPRVEEHEKRLDGAPEGDLFLVTVKTRDELEESDDVASEVEKLDQLLQLKQQEQTSTAEADVSWAHAFEALVSLRRFATYHQDQARRQLENGVLKTLVLPAASSLRSAMARNALLCVQDLILGLDKIHIAVHFDAIVPVLLNRTCSEKQFLKDLAREVLDTMLLAGANEEFLQPLLATSMTERNAQVVSVAGLYVTKCVIRMDREHLRKFVRETRSSFFDEMAAFLNCKVVECKAAARRACQHTRRVVGNEEFVALVKEKLSGSAQLDVLKASEIRKASKPGHAKSSIRERMLQMKKQQQQQKKVQSGGNDISVIVVAPPPPRSRSSSTHAASSS